MRVHIGEWDLWLEAFKASGLDEQAAALEQVAALEYGFHVESMYAPAMADPTALVAYRLPEPPSNPSRLDLRGINDALLYVERALTHQGDRDDLVVMLRGARALLVADAEEEDLP